LKKSYFCNNQDRANLFEQEYSKLRNEYSGIPLPDKVAFDIELVSIMISKLKRGKAAGIDGLMAEHLMFSHPNLPVILSKLFNLMFSIRYAPHGFKFSYIVPIPKPKDY